MEYVPPKRRAFSELHGVETLVRTHIQYRENLKSNKILQIFKKYHNIYVIICI
jgi:hypothetical protein